MPDSVPLVRKTVSCHYKILLIKPSEEIESSLVFVTEWVCNSQCKWRTLLCFVFNYCFRTWRSLAFHFCFGRVLVWDHAFHGPALLYKLNGPTGLALFHLGLSLYISCTRVRLCISWTSTCIWVKWANWIGLVSSTS